MDTKTFMSLIIFIFFFFAQTEKSFGIWNFSNVDLPIDVPIWRFAVWRNRAFLAIPKFLKVDLKKNLNNDSTLLEAAWPEPGNNYSIVVTSSNSAVRIFPKLSKAISNECEKLLSVTGLDVDFRGRLWVLDSPDEINCPAKIVIFDLRRNDNEIVRTNLQDIPKNNLKCLVIDPHIGIFEPRAYIGDPGDESIIIYSLNQRRWWRVKLLHGMEVPRVYSTEMGISRKGALLYITSTQTQDIFSMDLDELRNGDGPLAVMKNAATQNITVKWLGTKMGSSSGMICDQKGGLHYFLVTDHASVRWDTKHDLKTSSHSILLQSEEVPCITDYRVDLQKNIWGLVNLEHPFAKSPSTKLINKWKAKFRTVRINKYNSIGS